LEVVDGADLLPFGGEQRDELIGAILTFSMPQLYIVAGCEELLEEDRDPSWGVVPPSSIHERAVDQRECWAFVYGVELVEDVGGLVSAHAL